MRKRRCIMKKIVRKVVVKKIIESRTCKNSLVVPLRKLIKHTVYRTVQLSVFFSERVPIRALNIYNCLMNP